MTDSGSTCDYCGLPLPGRLPVASPDPSVESEQYCCFGCRFADAVMRDRDDNGTSRRTLTRLALSIFFAMNVMVFTMARWSADVYGDTGSEFSASLYGVFRYLCLLFTIPVMVMLGLPLFRHAWQGVRSGRLTSELLIVAGVAAAFAFSTVSVFRESGHTYFEVACMVLVLVTLGRWLEAIGRIRASEKLESLEKLLPATVCRVTGRETQSVALDQVAVGDDLRIRAGERFPVDGAVVRGRTTVDEHIFTGESVPVEKNVASRVLAGTLNLDGDVVVRATAGPGAGSFSRLLDVLAEARGSRGRYERMADSVAQWFVPVVGVIAAGVLIAHWGSGALVATMAALSVVLIACPCALGLATPLAVWTALGVAAARQVLFRSGESLERLAAIDAIRFDKTGTLTDGRPHVRRIMVDPDTDRELVIQVSAALSAASNHVLSGAISRIPANGGAVRLADIQSVPGLGVRGTLALSDRPGSPTTEVRLGSEAYVGVRSFTPAAGGRLSTLPENIKAELACEQTSDAAIVLVAWESRVRGLFVLGERFRPHVRTTMQQCGDLNLAPAILTGDRPARAALMADALGVSVEGGMSPQCKVERIRQHQTEFRSVAMVGDGINDAPALAAADVGISLACGADVTRDSADVCVLSDDLTQIPWAIRLARRTRRVVRQNLLWAFAYNGVGIVFAAAGKLNPAMAAGLMLGSSVFVIVNSMRLSLDAEVPPEAIDQAEDSVVADVTGLEPELASVGAG